MPGQGPGPTLKPNWGQALLATSLSTLCSLLGHLPEPTAVSFCMGAESPASEPLEAWERLRSLLGQPTSGLNKQALELLTYECESRGYIDSGSSISSP